MVEPVKPVVEPTKPPAEPVKPVKLHRAGRSGPAISVVGVEVVKLPPRTPNLSPHAEHFLRSTKSECLDKMIFFADRHLRRAIEQFVAHYHGERNHQGLSNAVIRPEKSVGKAEGMICCRELLGGWLRYYHRAA